MYINTHCNYSQPTLIKLDNENIGGHLTPLHIPNGNIPTGTPLKGASNAGGVSKKRDSGRISGFAAYRSAVLSTVRVANCQKQSRDGRRQASSTHRVVRRPLFSQDNDEVFVTGSTLYAGEEVKLPQDTTLLS